MLARALSQIQLSKAFSDVFLIPKTFFIANALSLTTLVSTLANVLFPIKFSKFLNVFIALKTFFTNIRPIFNLNDRPKTRKPLQTIFSNIRQRQRTMYKDKIPNLYEIVLDFSLSNAGSILINSFFGTISFANNRDDQKNSTPGTIYKSINQISEIGINIECKLVKKKQLTL